MAVIQVANCRQLTSVRETTDTGNMVAIIDLKDNNSVVRKNMTADSAIMHPKENIIALRAQGRTLQVGWYGWRDKPIGKQDRLSKKQTKRFFLL